MVVIFMLPYGEIKNYFANLQQLYLKGPGGREIRLCRRGAAVEKVLWPSSDGLVKNIALDSATPGDYAGATLGPVAGRIPGAVLSVEGERLPLCDNDAGNTLHGGTHGLSRQYWAVTDIGEDRESSWLEFSCTLGHGLDGFPGKRRFQTRYLLTTDSLTIFYSAATDRTTPISLSNHTYWNLSGDFSADCYDHLLEIHADGVCYNDSSHLPFALRPCMEGAFHFSAPVSLRKAMRRAATLVPTTLDSDAGQLLNANGYNNSFKLTSGSLFAARLTSPDGHLQLTLTTDQPYLVVYSGGYLSMPGCALALEAQEMPGDDAMLLSPGQPYHRFIRFTFSF